MGTPLTSATTPAGGACLQDTSVSAAKTAIRTAESRCMRFLIVTGSRAEGCGPRRRGRATQKVGANAIHRQNGLNLSVCVRKAGRAHVGPAVPFLWHTPGVG